MKTSKTTFCLQIGVLQRFQVDEYNCQWLKLSVRTSFEGLKDICLVFEILVSADPD